MSSWQKAAQVLTSGGVVIIPSDSSYGLAALAKNSQAVEKLYQIKGREKNKPSLVIISSMEQARKLVKLTPLAEELAKKHWPGGLTMVLEAKEGDFPNQIYGSGKTLAVRLPNHAKLQELAQEVGSFILPSANFAGGAPPFEFSQINEYLKQLVDYIIDEETEGNPPSTIVDARGEKAVILRPGAVSLST